MKIVKLSQQYGNRWVSGTLCLVLRGRGLRFVKVSGFFQFLLSRLRFNNSSFPDAYSPFGFTIVKILLMVNPK